LAQEWSSFRAPKGSVEDGGGMGVKAGKGHFGKEWLDGFGWDAPGPKKAPCELAGEKQRASEPEVECRKKYSGAADCVGRTRNTPQGKKCNRCGGAGVADGDVGRIVAHYRKRATPKPKQR